MEFIFAEANLPFVISLSIVFLLGLFELLSMVFGYSLVAGLDDWIPTDFDSNASVSGFTGVLGWLCLNKLPLLIWLVLVLISFSIVGFSSNFIALLLIEQVLPQFVSLPIALALTVLSCRYVGGSLAKILPKNESSAISINTLSGSVGIVTIGCARLGNPSEALVKDQYQQKHYVLVEPDMPGVEFIAGTQIVLLKQEGSVWSAAQFYS